MNFPLSSLFSETEFNKIIPDLKFTNPKDLNIGISIDKFKTIISKENVKSLKKSITENQEIVIKKRKIESSQISEKFILSAQSLNLNDSSIQELVNLHQVVLKDAKTREFLLKQKELEKSYVNNEFEFKKTLKLALIHAQILQIVIKDDYGKGILENQVYYSDQVFKNIIKVLNDGLDKVLEESLDLSGDLQKLLLLLNDLLGLGVIPSQQVVGVDSAQG